MEKKRIIYNIKNRSHKRKVVKEVIEFVKSSGGIDYANKVMFDFQSEALSVLDNFNDSVYKQSLKDLVQFTIERSR
jgi:octaprenyl-diphosphate synthase